MNRTRALQFFWKTKRNPNAPKTFAAVPQKFPYHVKLEEGKSYYWCACGLSKKQPFCDGAHKAYNEEHGTQLGPVQLTAPKTKKYLLCGCKHTSNQPYCDLSHVGVMFRSLVGKKD
ncbi:glutamate synthase domain protein [Trypanosoma grayi]|uniref:glutamate synthase domain protein n=1 Tax=Trypanosoma grayi TaxID=71804 RepID=UPI0004F4287B|nr:glutamate synthase domain protein [Trypanosoma grayi]KEG07028.1 glutamate synthase domain protein [Trypanosoma grayi]